LEVEVVKGGAFKQTGSGLSVIVHLNRQTLFGSNVCQVLFDRIDGDVKLGRNLLVSKASTA